MDAGDSECQVVQSTAGPHHRSSPHFGNRHGIVPIPPDDGQTEERRKIPGGNQIAMEMTALGKHGKPNPGFPPSHRPWKSRKTRAISTFPASTTVPLYIGRI